MPVTSRRAWMAALVLVLAGTGTTAAHTFYASLAQVERTADGHLEVAIRFFPDDLEEALRRATGRRVVVEDTKAFGAAFESWINAVFAIDSGGRRTRFTFVGAEVDVKIAWIYVEARWDVPLERSAITNVILVDLFPDQVNTVNVVEGDRRASHVFSRTLARAERLIAPAR